LGRKAHASDSLFTVVALVTARRAPRDRFPPIDPGGIPRQCQRPNSLRNVNPRIAAVLALDG
jgi:hypothetical protein